MHQHPEPDRTARPRRRPSASLALLASLLLTAPAAPAAGYDLPDMGGSADRMMSLTAETRLGRAFMRSVREALPVMDDPLVTSYIERLGQELVGADATTSGDFTFFVIDEPTVNAFAGPGGYIGVYAGLILAAQTESELAAVVAHEIAHVSQRHLMRGLEEQEKLTLPATALLVAAAILGAQVSPDAGMAAMAGIQAAALQRQINFTRDNEKEADHLGIQTLAAAGFDPYAMAGFFERLAKNSRLYENNAPEFLRTHPVTSNRIADALDRAATEDARQRADSLRFQMTRAKLRQIAYRRPEQALNHFRETLREGRYRDRSAERYGYALALQRAGQAAEAQQVVRELLVAHPSLPELIVLDAQLDQAQGRTQAAVTTLRQAVSLAATDWPLRVAYAEALLAQGQAAAAMDELLEVARLRPGNAMLYELLERAARRAGNRAATHRFRAEKLYAEGDLEPAIRQLEIALRDRDIPYHDAAQIQARLDLWREEQERAEKEDRKRQSPGAARLQVRDLEALRNERSQ